MSVCDPLQYEGDNSGYAKHLVDDHGVSEDEVTAYRRGLTQGDWLALDEIHAAYTRHDPEATVDQGPSAFPVDDWPTLVPAEELSERERWALRIAIKPMTSAELRELLDFLGYPDPMPHLAMPRVEAVVLRILAARARGEHIA